eukprot:2743782-Rhodomonas_salina.1
MAVAVGREGRREREVWRGHALAGAWAGADDEREGGAGGGGGRRDDAGATQGAVEGRVPQHLHGEQACEVRSVMAEHPRDEGSVCVCVQKGGME